MTSKYKTSAVSRLLKQGTLAVALPLLASAAHAGIASTPSLDAVYGAKVFDTAPVAIRWLTGIDLIQPALNKVTSFESLAKLGLQSSDLSPVVNAFFVDQISWCDGRAGSNFVGCSFLYSNVIVVESEYSSGQNGDLNIAHELGHTLGLEHTESTNLMNRVLGSSLLTDDQVTTVLRNSKVQTAADGSRFIEIRPISVLSAVPEPATYGLMLAGLALVTAVARRVRPERTAEGAQQPRH